MKIIAEDASNFHGKSSRKRGIAMFTALFVMIILGMLAVQFHYMSRQAQSDAFRFQASEIARQLAESAMDEAFLYIYQQTQSSDGAFFDDIVKRDNAIDCSNMSLNNKDSKGKDVDVALTLAQAANIQNGEKFNISATARIIDFRDSDSTNDGKYYGKEGVGTLEIKVAVTPKDEFKKQIKSACHITRHHDYKVVSMISKRDNGSQRTEYAQNYVLDYALFIRNGQKEFEATQGYSLNPEKWKLTIDQAGLSFAECGKICLGNTPGKYVYLNIDEARKDFLPTPLEEPEILEVDENAANNIFPELENFVRAEVKDYVEDEGGDFEGFDMYGHKGIFAFQKYPCTDDGINDDERKSYRFMTNTGKQISEGLDPYPNFFPGIKILPEEKLSDFIEGDVRQRFFHFGYFYIDLSAASIYVEWEEGFGDDKSETIPFSNYPDVVEDFKERVFPVFDNDEISSVPAASDLRSMIKYNFIESNYANSYPEIISVLDEESTYNEDPSHSYPQPKFFQYRSPSISDSPLSSSVPYAHVNLWSRRKLSIEQVKEFGIYKPDEKELNLRGIIQIAEPFEIGENGGPIKVNGQGVIIAPGITISSGIEKAENDSLCVLVTRGYPITIKTDKLLETSLVSMGKSNTSGFIKALEPLNLKGSLAVDFLRLDQWKEGVEHKIEYDPALKPGKDIYQVNIARWVSFQRMVEHD
jgi:Tfp pilus assembly protein PilX